MDRDCRHDKNAILDLGSKLFVQCNVWVITSMIATVTGTLRVVTVARFSMPARW
jgi:hypothetical protein